MADCSAPDSIPLGPTEALYAEYLAAARCGEGVDFADFCRLNPGQAGELHELRRHHEQMLRLTGIAEALLSEAGESLSQRLEKRYGSQVDPKVTLEKPESDSASSALLQRLSQHAPSSSRYQLQGELARGGMGAILRVW